MAKRVHRRLKKALEEQKNLEDELNKLQDSQDPKKACQEVIAFVQQADAEGSTLDPMARDDNPFTQDCFVAGTQITINGKGETVSIEDLHVGDRVMGLQPDSDKNETISTDIHEIASSLKEFTVTSLYMATKTSVTTIECRDTSTEDLLTLKLTEGHPLYVHGQGWKTVSGSYNQKHGYRFEVSPLKVGDNMCTQEGHLAEVISIVTENVPEGIPVYNLSVSDGHTFFANGIITHNKGCSCVIL